jgi:hypothetical protein
MGRGIRHSLPIPRETGVRSRERILAWAWVDYDSISVFPDQIHANTTKVNTAPGISPVVIKHWGTANPFGA